MNSNEAKILIVEDETIVALDIKRTLTKLNFTVCGIATNYNEVITNLKDYSPDILLMDINLGENKDGIDIVNEIKLKYNVFIIYLSAYSDEKTINRAVETNPVGYLVKPFKREELKTTLLLSLYKIKNQKKLIPEFTHYINLGNDYYYDKGNEILYFKSMPIKLGVKEKLLVSMLVQANGQFVSFREIEYMIWPDGPISDSTLRTLIYRLRSKLDYKLIETLSSVGCKITIYK